MISKQRVFSSNSYNPLLSKSFVVVVVLKGLPFGSLLSCLNPKSLVCPTHGQQQTLLSVSFELIGDTCLPTDSELEPGSSKWMPHVLPLRPHTTNRDQTSHFSLTSFKLMSSKWNFRFTRKNSMSRVKIKWFVNPIWRRNFSDVPIVRDVYYFSPSIVHQKQRTPVDWQM